MPGLNGTPQVGEKAVLVMCADHGVWDEGVAVSPKIVTAIQAANMTREQPAYACLPLRPVRRCMSLMSVLMPNLFWRS